MVLQYMSNRKPKIITGVTVDVAAVVNWLLKEPGVTCAGIARDLGISPESLKYHVRRAMTPEQRRFWCRKGKQIGGQGKPIGTIETWRGRRWIKHSDRPGTDAGNWMHLARWNWQRTHGPIPDGFVLWYRDRDQLNDSFDNLELVSRAESLLRLRSNPKSERRRRENISKARITEHAMKRLRKLKPARQSPQPNPQIDHKHDPKTRAARNIADFLAGLEAA